MNISITASQCFEIPAPLASFKTKKLLACLPFLMNQFEFIDSSQYTIKFSALITGSPLTSHTFGVIISTKIDQTSITIIYVWIIYLAKAYPKFVLTQYQDVEITATVFRYFIFRYFIKPHSHKTREVLTSFVLISSGLVPSFIACLCSSR